MRPSHGVQDALLGSQHAAGTRAVFAPKVTAALQLASCSAQLPLRCCTKRVHVDWHVLWMAILGLSLIKSAHVMHSVRQMI